MTNKINIKEEHKRIKKLYKEEREIRKETEDELKVVKRDRDLYRKEVRDYADLKRKYHSATEQLTETSKAMNYAIWYSIIVSAICAILTGILVYS